MQKKYFLKIQIIEIKNNKITILSKQTQNTTKEKIDHFFTGEMVKQWKEKIVNNKKYYYQKTFKSIDGTCRFYTAFAIVKQ